ncbi:hypothetical protein EX30DRAFT_250606 [Ascodesmis nigricans]|uniref:GATA-type domain-containing protein n=1 Tax=Ascodesmis nigricans TaxID=341454 RepID=A0A4S2MYD2_9PEZI|nr:hypothetical protein EX30DRAFT_250606 [Ascodesmis nigricans]
MSSSEGRKQSTDDVLPPMTSDLDRHAFSQRNPPLPRSGLPAASPISPTSTFGSSEVRHNFPPPPHNGINTPPESRRTSGPEPAEPPPRQSLPSLHDILHQPAGPFAGQSPLHTPPIANSPFSDSNRPTQHPPPPLQFPTSFPASQASLPSPGGSNHDAHLHRPENHAGSRALPPNPYSQAQPPPQIPAMQPPPSFSTPSHIPTSSAERHSRSPPAFRAAPYPPRPASPRFHTGPPPAFGTSQPPNSHVTQYPPYNHPPAIAPPPPQQIAHPPHPSQQAPYQYPPYDSGYPPPKSEPTAKGIKRGDGYAPSIQRAIQLSAMRRDLDTTAQHSGQIHSMIAGYLNEHGSGQNLYGAGLQRTIHEFNEAISKAHEITEHLKHCLEIFRDVADQDIKVAAQPDSAPAGNEYPPNDRHPPYNDARNTAVGQPEPKKIRRGRAAPPGRCHSCHRAETPEWRRGPDGARTLCNACGLHYAKLTRKLNKAGMAPPTAQVNRRPPAAST